MAPVTLQTILSAVPPTVTQKGARSLVDGLLVCLTPRSGSSLYLLYLLYLPYLGGAKISTRVVAPTANEARTFSLNVRILGRCTSLSVSFVTCTSGLESAACASSGVFCAHMLSSDSTAIEFALEMGTMTQRRDSLGVGCSPFSLTDCIASHASYWVQNLLG